MLVDVIVVRDGQQIRKMHRIPVEKYKRELDGLLKGYMESPEDYIAVRPSKRQVGE